MANLKYKERYISFSENIYSCKVIWNIFLKFL